MSNLFHTEDWKFEKNRLFFRFHIHRRALEINMFLFYLTVIYIKYSREI